MNGELSPLESLRSPSPSSRARAAGWFVQHPQDIETRDLMQALQTETVPQLRRLLVQVLESRQKTKVTPLADSVGDIGRSATVDTPVSEQVDIGALIRHELSPAVGWIRLAADSEITSFSESKTNQAVRRLQRRIDGLVAMIKEGEPLNVRRIRLPQVLMENWPDTYDPPTVEPGEEQASVEFESDEGLFALLLSNAFQNAIDASVEAKGTAEVTVTWGYTDRNYWVRIANPFKGDRLKLQEVVDVGRSSKVSHDGQGLSLMRTVASRLRIAIILEGASGWATLSLSGERRDG